VPLQSAARAAHEQCSGPPQADAHNAKG